MSSFAKLYDSPIEIARQYAIVITGAAGKVREKPSVDAHELTFMQVRSSHPVYAKCSAGGGRLHIEPAGMAVGNPRIYFLPWAKQCIYRIRPKPGNPVGLDENMLFTPNVDGCMVTVDGKPESPTVYHANAAGIQFSQQEEQAIQKAAEHGGEMENRLKIQKMFENVGVFQTIAPKNPPPLSQSKSRRSDFHFLEYDQGSKHVTNINKFDNVEIEQEVSYGAVFGLRKNGSWTFYKQSFRIYRKEWDVEDRGFLGWSEPRAVRKKIVEYQVLNARQFWP